MAKQVQSYECSACGKVDNKTNMEYHEPECIARREAAQKRRAEYDTKREKRHLEAIEYASKSEPLRLLVEHNHLDAARLICEDLVKWLWDCGTSHGWESLYEQMINSVKKQ